MGGAASVGIVGQGDMIVECWRGMRILRMIQKGNIGKMPMPLCREIL
jgi:hypothetical protein